MAGQTLNDRLIAARYALAGQGLARVVCKATTEEAIGPKKKHLDYLLHCTNEPNVSIPQLANLLIERTQHSSWVVVFKALVTVHHLMCYGNERFTQYLASSNSTFQLSNFLDKTGVQGYDMSTFVRRYAKYLNEKAVSYRTVAFDFCKVKRGKEDGTLRTMSTDKLLKTLPVLQNQLDALVEFDCTANDLTNGVINACFMLLFRDLIRLFACYNDGIINLLEKYFDMNKKNCREALDIYKKFLIRMDRVGELLKVAENVGIDKGDIPDLTKAPSSLLDALEQHLATLEGKKIPTSTTSAIGGGTTSPSAGQEVNGVKVDETLRKAVEEEAVVMNQLKFGDESPIPWEEPRWDKLERRLREMQSQSSGSTNPFLSSPTSEQTPQVSQPASNDGILDLFSSPPASATHSGPVKASDDLLCLNVNPFAGGLFGDGQSQTQQQQPTPSQPQQQGFAAFPTNGFSGPTSTANAFASDASFAAAFGDGPATTGFDAFGDVLQPQPAAAGAKNFGGVGGGGGVTAEPKQTSTSTNSLIKGDLDSCLASLAQNLDINGPKQGFKKPGAHQWGSPKTTAKTGGNTWNSGAGGMPFGSPQHGFQPMGAAPQWGGAGGMMAGPFPQQPGAPGMMPQAGAPGMMPQQPGAPGMMPQQPFGVGNVRSPATPGGVPMGMGMMPNASMGMSMPSSQPASQGLGMFTMTGTASPVAPAGIASSQASDPFGAL